MAIPKIKSATSLRNDLYETLKEVSEGDPQLITHKQGDPVILVSKEAYDKIIAESESLRKMAIGLTQIEAGEGLSHKRALQEIKELKKKWK
ncbi:MAG: type II toxin-antitoxin system Phd/YefM family antitoxin [Bdellovibrionales bacterium]|nr:type II toxin-antitoxin system Phd/YefM family antitoxin [Bdellovibrionales bacterium]